MANEWNKTAFVEFETMLRRHLRSGAAPVAACAGFDLDAASAYLEGALGGPHLASYESHLAGCAICRRHLIELARLAQTSTGFEAQPAAEPVRIPARDRLKKTVAGWFDLSTWNLKWQIASAVGGAFAILLAALGARSVYRESYHASDQVALVSREAAVNTSIAAAQTEVEPLPSPTPETSTPEADMFAKGAIAVHSGPSQTPVPTPDVRPKEKAQDFTFEARGEPFALSANQPSEAPVAPKPSGVKASQILPAQPRNFLELTGPRELGFGDFGGDSGQLAANVTAQDPRDMPRYQPSLIKEERSVSRLNAPPVKRLRLPEVKILSLFEIGKRIIGKSDSGAESERKSKSEKPESSDDGALNPMQIMIRDKIFCFEKCKGPDLEKFRGMWIDREYDFEKQKWNLRTLRRGSEEYKQVLADEPLLKEFFDHGPILIVWKNRVYKVLK